MEAKQRFLFFSLLFLIGLTGIPLNGGDLSAYHNFAQVADGGDYRTSFLLLNPQDEYIQITLTFRNDSGEGWVVSLNGVVGSSFTHSIPPRGVLRLETDRISASVKTGWAELTAQGEIGAQAFFEVYSGEQLITQAAVESTGPLHNVYLFVEESADTHTGIAVANLSRSGKIRLELELLDDTGQWAGSGELILAALQHRALFLPELIPSASQVRGTLIIRSSGPFEAVTLQVTGSILGTLPVIKEAY